jgi:hypothetical protein
LIQQRDTQFAVPPNRRPFYGQADFDLFVRQVVAKSEYFGEKAAAKVQQEIIDFFTAKHKMPANKDNKFYLERYNMVGQYVDICQHLIWVFICPFSGAQRPPICDALRLGVEAEGQLGLASVPLRICLDGASPVSDQCSSPGQVPPTM